MRVVTGRVVEGKVVVEDERLDEGATVTVFLPESDDEIELSPEEEAKIEQALKEADEGDFIEADVEQFLDQLDRRIVRRRLKLLRRASVEISEAFAWWIANRPAAPKAFTQDLRRALRAIAEQPHSGRRVRTASYKGVRRVHLSRIRYYLY